ncbi:MAG: T9SS type A sorting domain-containing protein [Lentimicrobium sp.]|nr:T9SS type A sorting domain-containing protein [Lentimicrobium sp.]
MKKIMLLALLIGLGSTSIAQETWRNITDTYSHRKILPDGQKIWLATKGGLICIDNVSQDTTYYNHANSGMPFTSVDDMCLDQEGSLWVVSVGAGIASKEGETWTSYNTTNTVLPNDRAFSIACDSDGNIWVNLMYYLVKYDGVSWTTYAHDTLGGNLLFPTWTAFDKDDRVLFGNDGDAGVRAWDGNQLTLYTAENSPLHSNRIGFVKTFPDGKTWIGYQDAGLTITDFSTWEYIDTLVPGTPLEEVYAFDRTSNGEYWLGTYTHALYHYDGNEWEKVFAASPVDSIRYIRQITLDENGKLYSAGSPNFTFDGENWKNITTPGSGMRGNSVRFFLHASDQTAWVASVSGMTGIRDNIITHYRGDDSSSYVSANCYAEDHNGKMYVGHGGGISKFEDNTWKRANPPTGRVPSNVGSMCFDGNNNLWFYYAMQLTKFDGTNTTVYSWMYNDFPAHEVYCMTIDINGSIVCGIDRGVAVWENNQWVAKLNPDAVALYPRVHDIAVRDNVIWLCGTDGLIKYDGSEWTTYNSGNSPIPEGGVWGFDFDAEGNIWFLNGRTNLIKFDGVTFEVIPYFESGMNWGLNSKLRIDHLNNIWIGGADVGISIYNEAGITLNMEEINPLALKEEIIQVAYPNPTNGLLNIAYKLPENQSGWMLSITDLQGRQIDAFALSGNESSISYSTDKLNSGLYLITVFNTKGKVSSTTKVQVIK